MIKGPITREERAAMLEMAHAYMLRVEPEIDRFVLAQLLLGAVERILPPVEEEGVISNDT